MSVSKSELLTRRFSCNEFESSQPIYKLNAQQRAQFQENDKKLALKISNIKLRYQDEHNLSSNNTYDAFENICQISESTIKKAMNIAKSDYKATRPVLYKLAVGLKMTVAQANELFELCGGPLRDTCLQDFICIRALEDGDDIVSFIAEMEEVGGAKIGLRDRKS